MQAIRSDDRVYFAEIRGRGPRPPVAAFSSDAEAAAMCIKKNGGASDIDGAARRLRSLAALN
jgi:hypothetical protein